MLAFLGNIGVFEWLFIIIIYLVPFILVCWLLIEIIRWLRRK